MAELHAQAFQQAKTHANLNAFITLTPASEQALADAQARLDTGTGGMLCGIPIAYKDIFCTANVKTTCASKLLAEYIPPYESHVTALLNAAGAICVGKCNMDEFAMGTTGENSAFGATRNPWNPAHSSGGSSSGSAVAVATRTVPVAIGTDTGGSVRMPAAYCGISGIKPTYGLVSRRGIIAYASSLDQAGVLATTAADLRATLTIMAAHDPAESTSLPNAALPAASPAKDNLRGLRVGIATEFFEASVTDPVATTVQEAVTELGKLGASTVAVSIPNLEYAVEAYYIIACAEASSNLARYDGLLYGKRAQADNLLDLVQRSRSEGFGKEVQRRILLGTFVLSHGYVDAYYRQAQKIRQLLLTDFKTAFDSCDLIAAPATPTTAPQLGLFSDDPVQMYNQDICTVTANLCGLPALSIPCGLAGGMPVGLQLIGAAHSDSHLLSVAEHFQKITDYHTLLPPGIQTP